MGVGEGTYWGGLILRGGFAAARTVQRRAAGAGPTLRCDSAPRGARATAGTRLAGGRPRAMREGACSAGHALSPESHDPPCQPAPCTCSRLSTPGTWWGGAPVHRGGGKAAAVRCAARLGLASGAARQAAGSGRRGTGAGGRIPRTPHLDAVQCGAAIGAARGIERRLRSDAARHCEEQRERGGGGPCCRAHVGHCTPGQRL
jgi:hypothetical protein